MFLKALLSGHSKKDNENSSSNSQHSQPITSISSDSNTRTEKGLISTDIHSNTTLQLLEILSMPTTSTIINPAAQKINDTSNQPGQNTTNNTQQHNVLNTAENKLTSFKQIKNMNSTIENSPILIFNNNNNNNNNNKNNNYNYNYNNNNNNSSSNNNNSNNNTTIELTAKNNATLTSNHISSSFPNLNNANNKVDINSNNAPFKQNSTIEISNQTISTSILPKTSTLPPNLKLASVNSSKNTKSLENINSVTECKSKQTSLTKATADINTRLSFNTRYNTEASTRNINTRLSYESPNKPNDVEQDDENKLLYECFKRYGPITEVYKKPCSPFGFVQYLKPKYAERAIRYEDDRYRWGVHIEVQKCQRKRTYAPTKSTSDCIFIPESEYYDYKDSEDDKPKDDSDINKANEPSNRNQNDKEHPRKSNRYAEHDEKHYLSSSRHKDIDYYKDRYSYDERRHDERRHDEYYNRYDGYYYSRKRVDQGIAVIHVKDIDLKPHSHKTREQHRSRERNNSENRHKITNCSSSKSPPQVLKGKDSISSKDNQNVSLINKESIAIKQTLKHGLKRPTDIDIIDSRTPKSSKTGSFEENNKIKLESDIIKVENLTNNATKEFVKDDSSNCLKNSHESSNNINQTLDQCKQYSIKENTNYINDQVVSQSSSSNHTGLTTISPSTSKTPVSLNVIQGNNKSIFQKHVNDPRLRNSNTILKNNNPSSTQPYFTMPNITNHNTDPRLATHSSLAESSFAQLQQNNSTSYSLPSNISSDPRFTMKLTQNNMNKANEVNTISPIMPTSISPIQNINTEPVTIMDNNISAMLTSSKISESYVVQLVYVGNLNQKLYIDIENQLSFIPKIKCRTFFYPFTNVFREEVLKQVPIMDTNAVLYMDESYQINNKVFLQIFNSQVTERVHFDEYEQISISDAILIIQQSIEVEHSNFLNVQVTHMPSDPSMFSWSSMELAPNFRSVPPSSTQPTTISSDHNDTDTNLQAIQYIISNLKQIQDYTAKNATNTLTSYNSLASNSDNINLVSQALLRLNTNSHLSPTIRHQTIQELLTFLLSSHTKQEYSFQQASQPSYENILAPLISSLRNSQSLSPEQQNAVQSLMNSFTIDSSKNN
ncbi:unnamed protein product [Cunninghamella echinulata]